MSKYNINFVEAVKSGLLDKKKLPSNVKKYYSYLLTNNSTPTEALAECQNKFSISKTTVYDYLSK